MIAAAASMAMFVILVCIFIFVFIVAAPFIIGGGLILGAVFLLVVCAGSGTHAVTAPSTGAKPVPTVTAPSTAKPAQVSKSKP